MIKVENYPNAYKEVYVVLNNMDEKYVKAIPQSFIDMIKSNMNKDYGFELNDKIGFEEQELLKETKAILAYIFLNYWGTEEQNAKIKEKFRQDIIKEEQLKDKYNPDELFKNKKNNNISSNKIQNEEVNLVEYKKVNIFTKLINIIKSIFKRK